MLVLFRFSLTFVEFVRDVFERITNNFDYFSRDHNRTDQQCIMRRMAEEIQPYMEQRLDLFSLLTFKTII